MQVIYVIKLKYLLYFLRLLICRLEWEGMDWGCRYKRSKDCYIWNLSDLLECLLIFFCLMVLFNGILWKFNKNRFFKDLDYKKKKKVCLDEGFSLVNY